MSVEYLDHRVPSLQEYIDRQTRSELYDENGTPRYAHPIDEWILRSLSSLPVKSMLDRAVDQMISVQMGEFLASSLPIDQKSFPDLFAILSRCADTLDIQLPHAITFDHPFAGLHNAFTAGTDEYAYIAITSGLCKNFSPEEASFVIGHECGHIASKHVVYHTLVLALTVVGARYLGAIGRVILNFFQLPLLAWARRSEITCDRAGLLCCGDIAVAERAFLRLIAGLADVEKVDVDDYLRRYKDATDLHSVSPWQQMLYSHPLIPRRIEALRLFARSELYHELTGKSPAPGSRLLSREELDRRVGQIVKP